MTIVDVDLPNVEPGIVPWPEPDSDDVEQRVGLIDDALHGARLDKAVVAIADEYSRSHLQSLIEQGHVLLDGVAATTPSRKVRAGQRLTLTLIPTLQSLSFRPEQRAIPIVFEDEHLLVVDKPSGWVVHPAAGNWSGTLMNALLAHHAAAAALPRAGIVHRLDKDTSGLMVVGKTLPAMTALVRAIAARQVHRAYAALAHGCLRQDQLRIEAPIGRDPRSRIRMAVVASGKPATTDVEQVACGDGVSALRCVLHTGRTHQIRVHLASIGHPLVADAVYGGRAALQMERQALHAARLAFLHPITGEPLVFVGTPPADFASAWNEVAGNLAQSV